MSYPAVAADTAAGLGLSLMRAEADSKSSTSTEGAVSTDNAVPPDFFVRKGEARRRLAGRNKRVQSSAESNRDVKAEEEESKVFDPAS